VSYVVRSVQPPTSVHVQYITHGDCRIGAATSWTRSRRVRCILMMELRAA
jgi:hypothetical protein